MKLLLDQFATRESFVLRLHKVLGFLLHPYVTLAEAGYNPWHLKRWPDSWRDIA